MDTSKGVVAGAIATYSCNEGYTLNGDENRTCDVDQDGMWSGTEPSCLRESLLGWMVILLLKLFIA